jgi:hypothetical protein
MQRPMFRGCANWLPSTEKLSLRKLESIVEKRFAIPTRMDVSPPRKWFLLRSLHVDPIVDVDIDGI